jgi:type I restriction enzyme M protein
VREFTEDRAFLRAVVSLSQDTFISSGASVKCSILFLEKFTEEEEKRFQVVRNKAIHDITKKHQPALDAKRAEIAKKVASASAESSGKDAAKAAATLLREQRAALKKELAEFEKRIAETIATESRALLKKRFDYPVFLYEAEKVGISATGEPDLNELYPNDRVPSGIEKTCLELYHEFRKDPAPFFVHGPAA